jgi:uncharacterized RDD family membrane protein YckC
LPAAHATPLATVPTAAQTKAAPLIAGAALAGMGDRAIATILDLVVAGAAFALVGMWAAARWGGVTSNGFELHGTPAGVAIGAVAIFAFLYVWLLEGVLGATLGKFILNVRVRRTDGRAIGFKQSLVRNLFRVIDGIGVYLVGFLIATFSHLKQRLGDHVARTVVVQRDSGPLPRAMAVVVWAAVIVASFVGAYRLHPDAGAAGVASAPLTAASTSVPPQAVASAPLTIASTAVPPQVAPTRAAAGGEGRVIRAELGTDRTPDYEIVNPSSEFYTDTQQIMCVWKVEGVDPSVSIKTVWIVDDSGGAAPPNYKIAEKSIAGVSEGSGFLTRPTNGWPAGKYHLEIYIGDKLAKQVPFTIKQR